MSDTPKTDAVEEAWDHLCLPRIIWNHARDLERENAKLLGRLDSVQKSHFSLSKDYAALREQNAELREKYWGLLTAEEKRMVAEKRKEVRP